MTCYKIYTADTISEAHRLTVLKYWAVPDWNNLTTTEFRRKFTDNELHVLINDTSDLVSVARINFNFGIQIKERVYKFSELVGLVAVEKMKGYGTLLLTLLIKNLRKRNIETIGFCEKKLRPFYTKAQIDILYDKARLLREKEEQGWSVPEDDDVLCINLSSYSLSLFNELSSDNLGYIIA